MNEQAAATTSRLRTDHWRSSKTSIELENGATLAYVDLQRGSSPPLLMVHGFTDSSRSWSHFVDQLPDHRLVLPDMRGHGDSGVPAYGYSLSHFADDMRLLLDRLGLEKVSVVGHSLGGLIGQMLAATLPDRVERLVLIGTTSDPKGSSHDLGHAIENLSEPIDPNGEFMMRWYANPGHVDEDLLGRLRHEASRIPKSVMIQSIMQNRILTLQPILGRIKARTLVMWGDADPFFDRSHQDALVGGIPNAEFAALPGLGHNPFWESPREVGAIISAFLARS